MEKFFSLVHEGDNRVLEAKKTIFWNLYGMGLIEFVFIDELGTCPQNLIFTRAWNIEKKIIFLNGVC
jgi:hypothetical protein